MTSGIIAESLRPDENPFTILYHFGNESLGPNRRTQALRETDALVKFFDALLNSLRLSQDTAPKVTDLRQKLQTLDIQGFYEAMPSRESGKGARLLGGERNGDYVLAFENSQEAPWTTAAEKLGDLELDLAVFAPAAEAAPEYGVDGKGRVNVGGIAPDEWSAAVEELMRRISQDLSFKGQETPMEEIRRRFPNLRDEDTRLAALLRSGLPKTYDRMSKYFEIRDLVNKVVSGGQPAYLVDVDFNINLEATAKDYPEFTAYIKDLTVLGSLDAKLYNLDRELLCRVRLDAATLGGRIQCMLRDGAILPCDENWNWTGSKPLRLTAMRSLSCLWVCDVLLNFSGLVFDIQDITLLSKFKRVKGNLELTTLFQDKPAITEVSGAAYGIFPSWLIDVVIPGNLQEMMDGFIDVATRGKSGDGTEVKLGFASAEKGGFQASAEFSTAILHSDFLATVSDIFGDVVIPTDAEREAIWRFSADAFAAFKEDYENFKKGP